MLLFMPRGAPDARAKPTRCLGLAILSALALLAACGEKSPAPSSEANTVSPAPVAAATIATGSLPSADAPMRFTGLWAADPASCKSKPWRFSADALGGAGAPHCSFYKVTKAPGGYDIAAECPTKEPVHTDLIRLRFAESAQAMLVESNAIPPTGLIYCGT